MTQQTAIRVIPTDDPELPWRVELHVDDYVRAVEHFPDEATARATADQYLRALNDPGSDGGDVD
jgi:hypothetical protein